MARLNMAYLLSLVLILTTLTGCGENAKSEMTAGNSEKKEQKMPEKNIKENVKYIIFFGNSLTAGYGLKESESFPALIQERIDSLGLSYKVVNAGLSGETTSGGMNRIDWVLRQPVDIFVLELGGNDVLRGLDLASTRSNLEAIIERVKEKYPAAQIIVAGMQSPPNMGPEYVRDFNIIFPELAEKYDAALIPFLLKDVGGIDSLNLDDQVHPNEEGQKIVMENVWTILGPMLTGK